jgi:hypothetical protein
MALSVSLSADNKKPRLRGVSESLVERRLHTCTALGGETILAEDRLATLLDGAGLERNLAVVSALGADGVVHLTIALTLGLASRAAVLAALGGAQVLAGVKLLFTLGEREGLSAIAARELLISHTNERRKIMMGGFLLSCFSADSS